MSQELLNVVALRTAKPRIQVQVKIGRGYNGYKQDLKSWPFRNGRGFDSFTSCHIGSLPEWQWVGLLSRSLLEIAAKVRSLDDPPSNAPIVQTVERLEPVGRGSGWFKSSRAHKDFSSVLAQLVEHSTLTAAVFGSNPKGGARFRDCSSRVEQAALNRQARVRASPVPPELNLGYSTLSLWATPYMLSVRSARGMCWVRVDS